VANLGRTVGGFGDPSDVLFEPEGFRWSAAKGLPTRQAVVPTFRGRGGIEFRSAEDRIKDPAVIARLDAEASGDWFQVAPADNGGFASAPKQSSSSAVYALADDYAPKASKDRAFTLLAGSPSGGGRKQVVVHPKVSGTLCASGAGMSRPAGMASELDFVVVTRSGDESEKQWTVRRFTPLECERLQGFPDYWTDVPYRGKLVADDPRYRALGNSMPCPVMSSIGHLLAVHIDLLRFVQADPTILEKAARKKRGRPPKHGVAMTDAERQRRRRERLREAETGNSGLPLGGLTQDISDLRKAIEEGSPDIHDRLSAIEAQLQRLAK